MTLQEHDMRRDTGGDGLVVMPLDSPCNFHVGRAVAWYIPTGHAAARYADNWHVLYREDSHQSLAVVGKDYKLVQNRELFEEVTRVLRDVLTPEQLEGVSIDDDTAYCGRDCFREYAFPAMAEDVAGSTAMFRLMIHNSFGQHSIRMYAGAIDAFCWNGMISGVVDKAVHRHSKGLTVAGLGEFVRKAALGFGEHMSECREWSKLRLTDTRVTVFFDDLVDAGVLSRKRADLVKTQYRVEKEKRRGGGTMWALYSAFTQWATHDTVQSVRKTGQDNFATTMLEREQLVHRIVKSETWRTLTIDCRISAATE